MLAARSCASALRRSAVLAALAWPLAPALAAPGAPAPLTLEGNLIFPDEVYLALVDQTPGTTVSSATAQRVRAQILKFLRRAGYELASVEARVVENRLEVVIDEGRLNKVVMRGVGSIKTLALKLELTLPYNIFNRFQLDRQLKVLAEDYDVIGTTYKLVPVRDMEHAGPQFIDTLLAGAYQLHLQLGRRRFWEPGLKLHLRVSQPDGVSLGTSYWGHALLFDDDHWRAGAWAAGNLFHTTRDEPYLAMSRGIAEATFVTPALWRARLYFTARTDYHSRQRDDIDVTRYKWLRGEGALTLNLEVREAFVVFLGGGLETLRLYELEQDLATGIEPFAEIDDQRAFGVAGAQIVLEPDEIRLDRRHELSLEARHYNTRGYGKLYQTRLAYQKVFAWGWHDIWVEARGASMWGDVIFPDEEPVGGPYLRGTFGGAYYVRRVAGTSLEFRLSLTQDLLKVSLFHDVAVFEQLDRLREPVRWRVANSAGAGLHALIIDAFQLDVYYGVGFSSDRSWDRGMAASLRKAF